jgi:putative effector of murein hydrolase LrgA (UPF0299 family)
MHHLEENMDEFLERVVGLIVDDASLYTEKIDFKGLEANFRKASSTAMAVLDHLTLFYVPATLAIVAMLA